MSDALNYLLKVRPDAMSAYFTFLKKSETHLDTRTRDLISVITKVAVQTEGGLRQYLTRALRNGATANEVIDALFMAFPVLGLAKIVWATEILLEMDIPEFRPENLDAKPDWHDIVAIDEIPHRQSLFLEKDGRHLFIWRDGDDIAVYDSRCPHQVTDIPHLSLQGTTLTCPKHQWAFDIESGECIAKGDRPLKNFANKVSDGRLLAYW